MSRYWWVGGVIVVLALVALAMQPGRPVEYQAALNNTPKPAGPVGYDLIEGADINQEISRQFVESNRRAAELMGGKRYIATSVAACLDTTFACIDDEEYFFDMYGCGCAKLDFSGEATSTTENGNGTAYPVTYNEAQRLRIDDSIELQGGDAMWIRGFNIGGATSTEVVFDVYIAVDDTTYQYPEDADKLIYIIEVVATDYTTYADVVVRNRLVSEPVSSENEI